jgi:hypothetical protein
LWRLPVKSIKGKAIAPPWFLHICNSHIFGFLSYS